MPTHDELPQFLREWAKLTPQQQTLFLAAVVEMVEDLAWSCSLSPKFTNQRCAGPRRRL